MVIYDRTAVPYLRLEPTRPTRRPTKSILSLPIYDKAAIPYVRSPSAQSISEEYFQDVRGSQADEYSQVADDGSVQQDESSDKSSQSEQSVQGDESFEGYASSEVDGPSGMDKSTGPTEEGRSSQWNDALQAGEPTHPAALGHAASQPQAAQVAESGQVGSTLAPFYVKSESEDVHTIELQEMFILAWKQDECIKRIKDIALGIEQMDYSQRINLYIDVWNVYGPGPWGPGNGWEVPMDGPVAATILLDPQAAREAGEQSCFAWGVPFPEAQYQLVSNSMLGWSLPNVCDIIAQTPQHPSLRVVFGGVTPQHPTSHDDHGETTSNLYETENPFEYNLPCSQDVDGDFAVELKDLFTTKPLNDMAWGLQENSNSGTLDPSTWQGETLPGIENLPSPNSWFASAPDTSDAMTPHYVPDDHTRVDMESLLSPDYLFASVPDTSDVMTPHYVPDDHTRVGTLEPEPLETCGPANWPKAKPQASNHATSSNPRRSQMETALMRHHTLA